MPQISKIKLPSGTVYDFKDATARQQISALVGGDAIVFKGVSTTALTDGGNEKPTIDGSLVDPEKSWLVFYGTEEFVYGPDSKWHALGSLETLGDLAYKDSASGNFTPAGTVSQPTFSGSSLTSSGDFTPAGTVTLTKTNKTATVSPASSGTATYTPDGSVAAPTISVATAGSTTTVKDPTSVTVAKTVVAAAPGATAPANSLTYYSVADETLSLYQLGYTTGDSITTSNVTVKTGDATYQASAPAFTGTGVRLVTGNISTADSASFSGTQATVSVSGTPSGTVSQPTFTGTQGTVTVS